MFAAWICLLLRLSHWQAHRFVFQFAKSVINLPSVYQFSQFCWHLFSLEVASHSLSVTMGLYFLNFNPHTIILVSFRGEEISIFVQLRVWSSLLMIKVVASFILCQPLVLCFTCIIYFLNNPMVETADCYPVSILFLWLTESLRFSSPLERNTFLVSCVGWKMWKSL